MSFLLEIAKVVSSLYKETYPDDNRLEYAIKEIEDSFNETRNDTKVEAAYKMVVVASKNAKHLKLGNEHLCAKCVYELASMAYSHSDIEWCVGSFCSYKDSYKSFIKSCMKIDDLKTKEKIDEIVKTFSHGE